MPTRNCIAIVGAQYGSEGKGVIVNKIANEYGIHVRVGGPNAGHSFVHKNRVWKMQVIPCGWTNPDAILILGRGMLVDLDQLIKEIKMIQEVDPDITLRLTVDARAGVLSREHHKMEGGVEGEMHKRIGSTGEGVGAARVARVNRDPNNFQLYHQAIKGHPEEEMLRSIMQLNTVAFLYYTDANILLEGTQGSGLSLIHGPWPYATSADTNAAQMCADVGMSPRDLNQIMLVARTYPIRVAGNSGPLKDELTWEQMSKIVGRKVEEKTTVTLKTRRVGKWDPELIWNAIHLNRPTSMALTFLDYTSPRDEGKEEWGSISPEGYFAVNRVEMVHKVPIRLVGTGGPRWAVIRRQGEF